MKKEERTTMGKIRAVLVVAALPLFTVLMVAQQPIQRVAVHAGNVLDVKSGKLLSNQIIVIEGDKIVSVGPAADAKVPAEAKRIELPNATILPGLRIGAGSLIGAGSVVTKNVEPGTVVAGSPAVRVKDVAQLVCFKGYFERPYVWREKTPTR